MIYDILLSSTEKLIKMSNEELSDIRHTQIMFRSTIVQMERELSREHDGASKILNFSVFVSSQYPDGGEKCVMLIRDFKTQDLMYQSYWNDEWHLKLKIPKENCTEEGLFQLSTLHDGVDLTMEHIEKFDVLTAKIIKANEEGVEWKM